MTAVLNDIKITSEDTEGKPKDEAQEVLGLQQIGIDEASLAGFANVAPGSCSSCAGSLCM
jgi:hypothetical protein